jgi:response regulator NasT
MNRSLRVVIADDQPDIRNFLQEAVTSLGHQVVAVASNGRELIQQCLDFRPDLAITDIMMPEMDGLQAAQAVNAQAPVPFLLVSGFHTPELLEQVSSAHIVGYLVKPVSEASLKTAIAVGLARFENYLALAQEAADLRQALAERKLIERAKGIVMLRLHINEDEAFRRLRRLASDQNIRLVEVARQIVTAEEVFQQMEID